ncbi:hypothetical protein Kpol_1018p109 [Vanderwaltozyma polyspora DSM 70294]|uniref:MSP domain-containing protein n=1 Tax=Vanderwaltozyma polyspora (strain ATCC 22028 / DSM 70294 / BCRC 21397 / CBS 2163 / NBRC 10782 / NRRL Y-8283 / UCD 57-17) TaxID=436907 RepID=A7TDV6_VANPO|nr:uncharacterized protein Kpol_1018p109 [Vanderwaltozyma polyspora DSM 70294]EDO19576.1 hypothetical protein Kpol_1018p109 [Vanderwaltozyma polyspora DSM 70294]
MSLVEITPDVLEFKSPFTVQSTEYASITNNSNETIAFKVKTTAPKFYCVRPNAAVVAPGETVQIQVILLGLAEEPVADFKCRDKFLVITLPSPYDLGDKTVAEAWPALEGEFKQQAVSKKMKVKYTIIPDALPQEQETKPELKEEQLQDVDTVEKHIPAEEQNEVVSTSEASKLVEDAIVEDQLDQAPVPVESEAPIQDKAVPASAVAEEFLKEELKTESASQAEPKKKNATEAEGSIHTNTLVWFGVIALILGWLYY